MTGYERAWAELRKGMENDRDNDGRLMSMAESIGIASHAKYTLTVMDILEKEFVSNAND